MGVSTLNQCFQHINSALRNRHTLDSEYNEQSRRVQRMGKI